MSAMVSTNYIIKKLIKNNKMRKHLTRKDLNFIKNRVKNSKLPSKIKSSDEIKPIIEKLVTMMMKRKVYYIFDYAKNLITEQVCNTIDIIIKQRLKN